MTDIEKIGELVDEELKEANKVHPLFVDDHQAYAVIKEEVEEALSDLLNIHDYTKEMWYNVKNDRSCLNVLCGAELHAMQLAAEAIQIAAMCKKAIDSEKARQGK